MSNPDLELPDPILVNPERYVAATSAFQGSDIELGSEDVSLFTGANLEDELDDLVEFRVLTKYSRGEKTVYRPKDSYAIELSEKCDNAIFNTYRNVRKFLAEREGEKILKKIQ